MSEEPGERSPAQSGSTLFTPDPRRYKVDLSTKVTFTKPDDAQHYRCGICLETARSATALCGNHIFCYDCAHQLERQCAYMNANDIRVVQCPICRKETACILIKKIEFIDRQIRQLTVKCPNHEVTRQRALGMQWDDQKKIERLQRQGQVHRNRPRRNRNPNRWRPSRRSRAIIARSRSMPLARYARSRSRSRSRSRERCTMSYSND